MIYCGSWDYFQSQKYIEHLMTEYFNDESYNDQDLFHGAYIRKKKIMESQI